MLKDTGERIIPEKMSITNGMLIEHLARYHFSVPHVYGRVLDFACGSGYGTQTIAKLCKKEVEQVIGLDNNEQTIKYAEYKYYHPSSRFILGDVVDPKLPEKLGTFDCIVSFETIEHVHEEEQFLTNVYQLLKPGGTLILSTPFGKGRNKPTGEPFHVHQLTVNEFRSLFDDFNYQSVEFYYQHGPLIVPEDFEDDRHFPLGIAICRKENKQQ